MLTLEPSSRPNSGSFAKCLSLDSDKWFYKSLLLSRQLREEKQGADSTLPGLCESIADEDGAWPFLLFPIVMTFYFCVAHNSVYRRHEVSRDIEAKLGLCEMYLTVSIVFATAEPVPEPKTLASSTLLIFEARVHFIHFLCLK